MYKMKVSHKYYSRNKKKIHIKEVIRMNIDLTCKEAKAFE